MEAWALPAWHLPLGRGPHDPGSIVFLWSLLIIQGPLLWAKSSLNPDLLIKPGVVLIYSSGAAFA